jgi:hypothetical protein
VPNLIALRGDPSDKGRPGVGAAGAAMLLQRYGKLEAALKAGRFFALATLRLYRSSPLTFVLICSRAFCFR